MFTKVLIIIITIVRFTSGGMLLWEIEIIVPF